MTEVPAPWWWALSLTFLLWLNAGSALADRTESGSAPAADAALPAPVLEIDLLKSHRKDDAWLKQGHYVTAASGPRLDEQLLDSILEGLSLPDAQAELSFWEALENWLNQYLGDRSEPVLPDWLRSYRLPEDTVLWVFYLSCALIVLLAVAIVGNEIRHLRGRRKPGAEAMAVAAAGDYPQSAEQEPATLLELPAWLLRQLIVRLGLSSSGTRGASLTHRQLAEAGADLPQAIGQPLAELAQAAELIRYGNEAPARARLTKAVQDGKAVLQSLEDGG